MSAETADADTWPNDAVSAVEFPAKAKGSLGWRRAFRAVLTRIHEQGTDVAAGKNLRTVANREEPWFEWTWAETVLPWLPGVSKERAGRWVLDHADADRHYFTTWLRIVREWSRDLIRYLRGDRQSGGEIRSTRDAIDSYIHA
jgi:hypothetical protein